MAQISVQQPLADMWMQRPEPTDAPYLRAVDPNYREYLAPMEMRRMGHLLKRAAVVSDVTLKEGHTEVPDAIFIGTGLGCVESTELFLDALCRKGEDLLSPAQFMQSTHNTISSLIAIRSHCHGENMTFSHKSFSFEQALHEALLSLLLTNGRNVLVGGFDEVTPAYFTLLRRAGYVGQPCQVACSETAMSALLSRDAQDALAELADFQMGEAESQADFAACLADFLSQHHLSAENIDTVLTGHNGVASNDVLYDNLLETCLAKVPRVAYKKIFGENYSVSALGFYAAARLLQADDWPAAVTALAGALPQRAPHRLLIANLSATGSYAFILLQRVGN